MQSVGLPATLHTISKTWVPVTPSSQPAGRLFRPTPSSQPAGRLLPKQLVHYFHYKEVRPYGLQSTDGSLFEQGRRRGSPGAQSKLMVDHELQPRRLEPGDHGVGLRQAGRHRLLAHDVRAMIGGQQRQCCVARRMRRDGDDVEILRAEHLRRVGVARDARPILLGPCARLRYLIGDRDQADALQPRHHLRVAGPEVAVADPGAAIPAFHSASGSWAQPSYRSLVRGRSRRLGASAAERSADS